MKVLVTGANGFIGKNLIIRLKELKFEILYYTRNNLIEDLKNLVEEADAIIHLAGENRPKEEKDFDIVNIKLTKSLCDAVRASCKNLPFVFTSSTQAVLNNAYGKSKLEAENALKVLQADTGCPVYIYRLPGVFGKWCKPNYNSVVATFCYNISRNLPIKVDNPSHELTLVYIDDVVEEFISIIQNIKKNNKVLSIKPKYKIKLSELIKHIESFHRGRVTLLFEKVGSGLIRKLYSTYLSYLLPNKFSYSINSFSDERGIFAEILKTKDNGQFSFFTAKPGVTRGGHYHHSKTEKFLVVQGKARFKFKHIISNKTYQIILSNKELKIIETVPGWAHQITNIGKEDLIVILWANEIFDHKYQDTIAYNI